MLRRTMTWRINAGLDEKCSSRLQGHSGVAGEEGGLQVRWLRNPRDVRLRLRSTRAGVMLDISATGVVIELR